jgi:hypothetical protein
VHPHSATIVVRHGRQRLRKRRMNLGISHSDAS